MKANLIAVLILTAIAGVALLRAEPAACENCRSGMQCWSSTVCGGCSCLRPGGLAAPGFCG